MAVLAAGLALGELSEGSLSELPLGGGVGRVEAAGVQPQSRAFGRSQALRFPSRYELVSSYIELLAAPGGFVPRLPKLECHVVEMMTRQDEANASSAEPEAPTHTSRANEIVVLKPDLRRSPLDVEGVDLGISREEIVSIVRESRER